MELNTLASAGSLAALAPLLLLGLGALPLRFFQTRPKQGADLSVLLSMTAFVVALGSLFFVLLRGRHAMTFLEWGSVSLGVLADRLSGVMLVLVSFVVTVVAAYARTYLRSDPVQPRFTKWFGLTSGSVLCLMVSGNLVQFILAWIFTSVCLHKLLVLYPHRVSAVLAARKKFVVSRLGDLCLVGALALVWSQFGTWDFVRLFDAADAMHRAGPGSERAMVHWTGFLLALGAMLKSAQFPFHSWLPDTMETPTPVSALMHAGIINAGGFLILRLQPLVTLSGEAMMFLAICGGFTALFASVVMLTQASIKRGLAFSTVAQMGFMMLECGVGAFAMALLHLVAHSLYKAHAFLSSGSGVNRVYSIRIRGTVSAHHWWFIGSALAFSISVVLGGIQRLKPSLLGDPGAFLLAGIVCLSGAYVVGIHWANRLNARTFAEGALAVVGLWIVSIALHAGAESWLRPVAQVWQLPASVAVWSAIVGMLVLCGAVLIFQLLLSSARQPLWVFKLYVHARNGFYINTLANRFVTWFWPLLASAPSVAIQPSNSARF